MKEVEEMRKAVTQEEIDHTVQAITDEEKKKALKKKKKVTVKA